MKIKLINNISHEFDNTLSQDPQRPRGGMWPRNQKRISLVPKNHVARRRSLSRRRIVPVTLLLDIA